MLTEIFRCLRLNGSHLRLGGALPVAALSLALFASVGGEALAQPVISGVNPSPVTYGITPSTQITISGSGFQLGATITVGSLTGTTVAGSTATATTPFVFVAANALRFYWTNTSLPPDTYDVVVTNPDSQAATPPGTFTVNAPQPTVSGVTPTSATYGITPSQSITITGTNFVLGATITVGSLSGPTVAGSVASAAVRYVWVNSNTLRFWWPNADLPPSAYAVQVTNPAAAGGLSASLAAGFTVNAPQPTVTSTLPNPVTYGITPSLSITISGTNFVLGATVTVGSLSGTTVAGSVASAATPFVHVSSSTIRFWWPNTTLTPGAYDVQVSNPAAAGGLSATLAGGFTVAGAQASISSIAPAQVTFASVNLPITIFGTGFASGATIAILDAPTASGGTVIQSGPTQPGSVASAALPYVFVSATRLSFYWNSTSLPPGLYTVRVTNPPASGGLEDELVDGFEVVAPLPVVTAAAPSQVTYDVFASRPITVTGSNFVLGAIITVGTPSGGTCALPSCLTGTTVSGFAASAANPFVFVTQNQLSFYWDNSRLNAAGTALDDSALDPGTYRVSVQNPAVAGGLSSVGLDGAFTIVGPVPQFSSFVPSSVEYNETTSQSIRINGANFYPPIGSDLPTFQLGPLPPVSCVSGPTVATENVPCVHISKQAIEFFWKSTADASDTLFHLAPGEYRVTITNPAYAGAEPGRSLPNAFTVTAPTPRIQPNGIRPLAVTANITPPRVVDVAGVDDAANHFGFAAGATLTLTNIATTASTDLVCNAGTVPSASARCVFVGPGLLRFFWDTAFLGVGSYDVTVVNPASRGGLSTPEPGRFRVTALPELIDVAPGAVGSGARSAVVTLTTAGFSTGSVVRIGLLNSSNPPYVDTQDSQVTMRSAFRAFASGDGGTVVIDVAEDQAQPADRPLWVTITSPDGQYRFTCPDPANGAETCTSGLTITRPPVVTAVTPVNPVTPALGVGSSGRELEITGDRFVVPEPDALGTTVTLPTGVSGTCTAGSPTTIDCIDVAVAATVSPGGVSVIVTNPDGGRTTGTLTISAPPMISSLSPASGTAGASFTVRVLGSGFQAALDLTGLEFSSDITVNSFQRIDAGTLDLNLTITPGAADGYRSLTITNPDGGVAVAPQAFYVGTLPSDTAQVLATFGEQGESIVQYQRSLGPAWATRAIGPALSSPPVWQVMKANPTRDERLLAVVDDQRRLTVHVWNGQTWANALAAASSTGLARPSQTVDVAFEQQSGRGVVVYATTESTTLRYRVWDGTAWGAEALVEDLVNGQQTTGRPLWVRLEARPTTNDLVLVYGDQDDAIAAAVWRGDRDQWEDSVLLTSAAASHEAPVFDLAFERGPGRAMVVWVTGAETTPHYRMWNRDANDLGGWLAGGVAPSVGVTTGQPIRALRAVGDASNGSTVTNRIALIASSGTTAPALEALVWDGAQWSATAQVLTTTLRTQDGVRGFDAVSQGVSGNFLVVYATTANPDGVSRTYTLASGAWSPVEINVSLPASASPALSFPAWTELAASPGINDVALTQFDTLGRVLLARWNGAAWSAATEAQALGSGLVGAPPVAGKSVAVTLAQHLRGAGPGITSPTSPVDAIVPGTPTLSAGTATINTVNLSWTAVASDGLTAGGPVESYELQQILGSVVTTRLVDASQSPGGAENYAVIDLSGAKTYFFNVRAVDAAGNRSPWSNRVTVVTAAAPPPSVSGLAVQAGSIYRTSVTLVWPRPSSPDSAALAEYIVRYKTGGAFTSEQDFDAAQPELRSTGESITIDDLQFGVTYWFAVKVVDVLGVSSAMSNVVQATTADHTPDPITDLRVIGATTSSVTLRWTMPTDDSGLIAFYTVKYTSSATIGTILTEEEFTSPSVLTFAGQPTRDISVEPFVETVTVTGLTTTTQYWFSVKAIDATGQQSPLSGSPTATTSPPGPDTTAPGPITDLAVVASSTTSSSLDVSWTATGDDGTVGTATTYDVRYATFPLTGQNFSQGRVVVAPQPALSGSVERVTLVGLSSNSQYFIAVRVVDEDGNASFSNVAVGQTGLRRGYTLVSIPKVLSTPNDTVLSVFGDDVGTVTAYRWSSRGLDVSTGCYDGYPSAFMFDPQYTCTVIQTVGTGLGYYLYNASESVSGRAVLDATGGSVSTPTYDVPLALGFNMVGNPYEREIHLSAVTVKRGSTGIPVSYQQAIVNGWVGPSLLLFDGVVSRPYGVSDSEAVLKPWNGGWIQSFVDDAILVFSGQ